MARTREDETPTTVVAADGSVEGEASPVGQSGSKRSARRVIFAATAAIVVIAIAAGAFLFVRSSQEAQKREAVALAAATVVSETMTELSGAQTTEGIRAVAVAARDKGASMAEQGGDDPRVTASTAALSAIAALDAITPDTLAEWPAHRAELEQAVRGIAVGGTSMDPGPVLAAVDATVAGAQQTLGEWQLSVNVIQQEQSRMMADLNSYEPPARSEMEDYADLRDSTADWLDRTRRASSISVSSTTSYLEDALSDRKGIRDSLSRLTPPPPLASQHNEVISAVNLGIDGIDSLLDGMESLEGCSGTRCTLERNSGYGSFLSASSANTGKFDSAYESWIAAAANYRAEIESMTVPTKPAV
jgi:hypothetical protein